MNRQGWRVWVGMVLLVGAAALPARSTEDGWITAHDAASRTVIDLVPHSVRTADFQVLVESGDLGSRSVAGPAPLTLRGRGTGGLPGRFAASLASGRLRGFGLGTDGRGVVLEEFLTDQAGTEVLATSPRAVMLTEPVGSQSTIVCDAGEFDRVSPPVLSGLDADPFAAGSHFKVAVLAIDMDYEYFIGPGGGTVDGCVHAAEELLNAVSLVYEASLGVSLRLGTVLVRDTPDDPYSQGIQARLDQLQSLWNTTHASIERDLVHLLTGFPSQLSTWGLAHLGVVCDVNEAYSVGTVMVQHPWQVATLTAHELGHQFGAPHCGCAIMCAYIGACGYGNTFVFSPDTQANIHSYLASVACLAVGPPTELGNISSVNPEEVSAVGGQLIDVLGSGITDTRTVWVHTDAWVQAEFDVVGLDHLQVVAPQAGQVGEATMVLVDSIGRSTAYPFQVVPAASPQLNGSVVAVSVFPYSWIVAATPGAVAMVMMAPIPDVTDMAGWSVLSEAKLVHSVVLDAAGIGVLQAPIPGAAAGLTLHTQAWIWRPGFLGATNILTVDVVF